MSGFTGSLVSLGIYYPAIETSDLIGYGAPVEVTAGTVAFPNFAELKTGSSGVRVVDGSLTLSDDDISFTYTLDEEGVSFADGSFNGYVINDLSPNAEEIKGVSLLSTNIRGLTNADLSFSNDTVVIDVSGLTLPSNAPGAIGLVADFAPSCFASGSQLKTDSGERKVESLLIGDQVATISGELKPLKWIGMRYIDCRNHPKPQNLWPVRVRSDAFSDNSPHRDLWLSPDHAVFVDDVLIPIKYLINGTSVRQVETAEVTYFHIQLDQHDVLLAEGLPAESYLDTGNRSSFANGGIEIALHPDFSSWDWEARGCAPLVVTGPVLDAVKQRLNARVVAARDCCLEREGRKVSVVA